MLLSPKPHRQTERTTGQLERHRGRTRGREEDQTVVENFTGHLEPAMRQLERGSESCGGPSLCLRRLWGQIQTPCSRGRPTSPVPGRGRLLFSR